MLTIERLRHVFPEKAGFLLKREHGYPMYTFLHFFNPVELLVGGRVVRTRPHACILYAPDTPQQFYSPTPLIHDWLHFFGEPDTLPLSEILSCNTVYYPSDAAFVTDAIQEMETEFFANKKLHEQLLSLKLQELLIKLSRSAGEESLAVNAATAEQFRLLRGEVFAHLGERWTAARMADIVHLSQSHFFSVYKHLYGISPIDDLIRARIEAAQSALSFGNESLSDIAERLGYASLTHFMRQFRAHTGETPRAFWKKQRGNQP